MTARYGVPLILTAVEQTLDMARRLGGEKSPTSGSGVAGVPRARSYLLEVAAAGKQHRKAFVARREAHCVLPVRLACIPPHIFH